VEELGQLHVPVDRGPLVPVLHNAVWRDWFPHLAGVEVSSKVSGHWIQAVEECVGNIVVGTSDNITLIHAVRPRLGQRHPTTPKRDEPHNDAVTYHSVSDRVPGPYEEVVPGIIPMSEDGSRQKRD